MKLRKTLSVLLSALLLGSMLSFTAAHAETGVITSLSRVPQKLWGITEADTVTVPAEQTAAITTNLSGVSVTPVWQGADGFTFGTSPAGDTFISYTATLNAPSGCTFDASLAEGRNVELSTDAKTLTYTFYTYVIPNDAYYVSDSGSDNSADYVEGNYGKPFKTLQHAYEMLQGVGGGTIVVKDLVSITNTTPKTPIYSGSYKIVGWNADSVLSVTNSFYVQCEELQFLDITMERGSSNSAIYANGQTLTIGDPRYDSFEFTVLDGFTNARQVFITGDGGTFTNPGKLTINCGTYDYVGGSGWNVTTVNGDLNYEINGGTITGFFWGLHSGDKSKGEHKLNGDVHVVINGGTFTTTYPTSNYKMHMTGDTYITVNGGSFNNLALSRSTSSIDSVTYPIIEGSLYAKINGGDFTGSITCNARSVYIGSASCDILEYEGPLTFDALKAKVQTSQFDSVNSTVIYVDYTDGSNSAAGTEAAPLKTLTEAFKKFSGGVGGKIVLVGSYPGTESITDTAGRGAVIFCGADENAVLELGGSRTILGDITFKDITLESTAQYKTFSASGAKLVFEDSVKVINTTGQVQLGGVGYNRTADFSNITVKSGEYGLTYTGADLGGGECLGDMTFNAEGGKFIGEFYFGGYLSNGASYLKQVANGDASLKKGGVGGTMTLNISGGEFTKTMYIGGKQLDDLHDINVNISGGSITGTVNVGPYYNSDTLSVQLDDGSTYSDFDFGIDGDIMINITGGNIAGQIKPMNLQKLAAGKKAIIIANNGVSVNVGTSTTRNFDYVVKSERKGTVSYDKASGKFKIVPANSAYDIIINGTTVTKSADNLYTLSGGTNNVYNITYGGEVAADAAFVITQPIAELTPVSTVIATGGKNTSNPLSSNCNVSTVTWSPAHAKFEYDTVYTATVKLTSKSGLPMDALDTSKIHINADHVTPTYTFKNDNTEIEIRITFPKTASAPEGGSSGTTPSAADSTVTVTFTTQRDSGATNLHNAAIVFTNVLDASKVYYGEAVETGNAGTFTGTFPAGTYNVTVKKQGYLAKTVPSVTISAASPVSVPVGALTAGDVVGNGSKNGDGKVNVDDFVVFVRALNENASAAVTDAADITEDGIVTVADLSFIKSNFGEETENIEVDIPDVDTPYQNSLYRLTHDKKFTVGYLGGSIIQGSIGEDAGNSYFIDRMDAWFESNFPDADVHSINAGISNTGSNFGIQRLKADLMERDAGYVPDMVFVEFTVNDFGTFGSEQIEYLYESLINDIYAINPYCDIICLSTAMNGGYRTQYNAHKKITDHYGLEFLDLGTAISDNYNLAGDCKVFTNDDLHPNGMGYELYFVMCKNLLKPGLIDNAPASPKYTEIELPATRVYNTLFDNPAKYAVTDPAITWTGSWTSGSAGNNSRLFNGSAKTVNYKTSSTVGNSFTFSFDGDAFGFYFRKSADMGTIEYSVDGGTYKEFDAGQTQATYTHFQTYILETPLTGLTDGHHTVTVRVKGNKSKTATQNGSVVGIAGVFYNASAN